MVAGMIVFEGVKSNGDDDDSEIEEGICLLNLAMELETMPDVTVSLQQSCRLQNSIPCV